MNIIFEISRLRETFENLYRFEVDQWDIPSANPTQALKKKIYDFQDAHQSKDELLIVYYGGHGKSDYKRGRSIWQAYVTALLAPGAKQYPLQIFMLLQNECRKELFQCKAQRAR